MILRGLRRINRISDGIIDWVIILKPRRKIKTKYKKYSERDIGFLAKPCSN